MESGPCLRRQDSDFGGAGWVKADLLRNLRAAQEKRQPVAVITDLATGAQRMVARAALADDPLAGVLDKAFRFDKSGVEKTDAGEHFITIHNPPLRLVITGAVLIAQSLIPMAKAAGYDVWVVDPRGAFATGARFPDISLHAEWPDEIIPKIGLDARTAFVALTHDPKIDDPALELALKSDVFYIGALGSKKTHGGRIERLKARGFDDAAQARIFGPIGLEIGAVGAAEIAISIMAQMTKALRLGL
jgi:xanthine dehydrogenase accessory factor